MVKTTKVEEHSWQNMQPSQQYFGEDDDPVAQGFFIIVLADDPWFHFGPKPILLYFLSWFNSMMSSNLGHIWVTKLL